MAQDSTLFLMKLLLRKAREGGAERAFAVLSGAEIQELRYLLVKAGLALYDEAEALTEGL